MLKSYHENQREQNHNYVQLNWLEKWPSDGDDPPFDWERSGIVLSVQSGEDSGCVCGPELLFTGVTKLVVAEGPETAPIIPGVVIQARPGIAQRRQRLC